MSAPRKKKVSIPLPLFSTEEKAQVEPESVAIARLLAAKVMPWATDGPPWISGLSRQRLQALGRKHYQTTGHKLDVNARGIECTACGFKAFGEVL